MKIQDTRIEDAIIDLKPLDHLMKSNGFIRAGQWDYERVTYDYKVGTPEKNITYYVRIQGYAIEGDVDRGDAVIKLLTPLVGKHYYPHGVEYGDQENIPQNIIDRAKELFANIKKDIDQYKQ